MNKRWHFAPGEFEVLRQDKAGFLLDGAEEKSLKEADSEGFTAVFHL